MSTEIDTKNTNKADENDWDVDEDDDKWDDWGDAEDNFDSPQALNPIQSNGDANLTNNNNSKKIVKEPQKLKDGVNCNSKEDTNKQESQKETVGWGGLFGGVVSSVLSTASDLSSTVSQGFNQVIGVPDPEELVVMQAKSAEKINYMSKATDGETQLESSTISERQTQNLPHEHHMTPVFGMNIVSGVTSLGTKVLNTGLDTLEGIGKKTMNILQENDPLLMNKRKLLGLEADRPNLSEVLKEAKKDADNLENTLKELKLEKSREMLRFDVLFENFCGLVHFEALEILSKESVLKLQKLQDAVSGMALTELQETIDEVKELLELEDLDGESDGSYDGEELNSRLRGAIEDADLQISFDDIANHWTKALQWLGDKSTSIDSNDVVQDIFARGITYLAEACALEMSKLHKIAELLLVKDHHSTANEVDCIVQLCKQFNIHLNGLTNRFAGALTLINLDEQKYEELKSLVSTLFAEMLVASQQIEKGFNLFLPILQIGAV